MCVVRAERGKTSSLPGDALLPVFLKMPPQEDTHNSPLSTCGGGGCEEHSPALGPSAAATFSIEQTATKAAALWFLTQRAMAAFSPFPWLSTLAHTRFTHRAIVVHHEEARGCSDRHQPERSGREKECKREVEK